MLISRQLEGFDLGQFPFALQPGGENRLAFLLQECFPELVRLFLNFGLIRALPGFKGKDIIAVLQEQGLGRVGLLLGGKLIELLPAERFFDDPIDPRTRSFLNGEMVY